jgi:hypothetical protein
MLLCRYGASTEEYDDVRQVSVQDQRGRRQGEDATHRLPRILHGQPRRRLRARLRVWTVPLEYVVASQTTVDTQLTFHSSW